jgi:Dolichyl-phosphate-mannose-protein mannosyltransferase
MSGLAQRNGGPVGLAALALILLLGLGLRLDYAWDGREPVFDATAYAEIARGLEQGRGFELGPDATQPASNYSPGLPLLVAGFYEVTGGVHERGARQLLALIGALAVLFTYLIDRRLAGPAAGLIGAAAVAIYPALLEYQGMLMGEPLAATLLSGTVLAMLWARERTTPLSRNLGARASRLAPDLERGSAARETDCISPPDGDIPERGVVRSRATWLLPGMLLGALMLVRPEYLGVSALLSLVVLAGNPRDWQRAAVLLAGLALVVVPWTVRNAIELERFVPVSTGGGQVLFAGTYLPSDGDPEKVGAEVVARHPGLFDPEDVERLRLEQILARLAAQRYPGVEADKALARMGREQLWDDVTEEPVEYASFVATKVWRIWSQGPRQVMERPGWKAFHWVLVSLGLLGLVVLARRRPWEALLLATIFVAITAISALLVASPRRVLAMLPLVAALAGVGAVACRDSLARWNR